jgi:hypothetical protein
MYLCCGGARQPFHISWAPLWGPSSSERKELRKSLLESSRGLTSKTISLTLNHPFLRDSHSPFDMDNNDNLTELLEGETRLDRQGWFVCILFSGECNSIWSK